MFKDRLKELLEIKFDGNQSLLAEKTQIPKTTINGWLTTQREPNSRQLITLANFFECTIDYLIGRENEMGLVEIKSELSKIENEIISMYRKLDERRQFLAYTYVKGLAAN